MWLELGMDRAAARETPMSPAVVSALRKLGEAGDCDLHILSDANSVFISEILVKHGLASCIDGIHTNPASFCDGALRVRPFHDEPHGCALCPSNLCKGAVMEQLLMRGQYARVVYVGDGGNDFCPSCRTGPWDTVLARSAYPDGRKAPLVRKLRESRSLIVDEGRMPPAQKLSWRPHDCDTSGAYTGQDCPSLVYVWHTPEQLAQALLAVTSASSGGASEKP
jgi:HAD superfamily phosphoserine phosphatase-like hydrolase